MFAVNPLGVQSDGALVETGRHQRQRVQQRGGAAGDRRSEPRLRVRVQGHGSPTTGYEVEVRIPFKSLRFQPAQEQRWGINVTRQVQHSGAEDSWAPAKRASASFLGQSGHLVGLTDLRRGLVLEFNPSVTSKTTGRAAAPTAGTTRAAAPSSAAACAGASPTTSTSTRTANPDFSPGRVGRGPVPVRSAERAASSPEKRPFFLDGIEQFTTPNYADLHPAHRAAGGRRQAHRQGLRHRHRAALRGGRSAASPPTGDDHPVYNLLRLQRDVGAQSRLGMVYTDRVVGSDYNRVAGADARLVFGEVYSVQLQLAGSRTRTGGVTSTAPALVRRGSPGTAGPSAGAQHSGRAAIRTSARGAASSRARGCRTSTSIRG